MDGAVVPGHPQIAAIEGQARDLLIAQAVILGQDHLYRVAAHRSCRMPPRSSDGGRACADHSLRLVVRRAARGPCRLWLPLGIRRPDLSLVLNLEVRRIAPQEIEQRVGEVSRLLGLGELLTRKPAQLSGGQRQRVALGRALIRRPNIFLMDEPLSNLDLKRRERTRTELKKLHERLRVTTIYVTHGQAEALVLSDRIGIMNAGELLQVGTPQKIYDEPTDVLVAKFVGSPSINLLPVTAEASEGWLTLCRRASGGKVAVARSSARPDVIARITQTDGLVPVCARNPLLRCTTLHLAALRRSSTLSSRWGQWTTWSFGLDGVNESTADGEPLIAVVRSDEKFEQGAAVWLAIRPDRLVLFQARTGKALAALSSAGKWQCMWRWLAGAVANTKTGQKLPVQAGGVVRFIRSPGRHPRQQAHRHNLALAMLLVPEPRGCTLKNLPP